MYPRRRCLLHTNGTRHQLLHKLPTTVRGLGLELVGSFNLSVLDGKKEVDGFPGIHDRRQDLANLIGYIAVVRTHAGKLCGSHLYHKHN